MEDDIDDDDNDDADNADAVIKDQNILKEQLLGGIIGFVVGDALGSALEFSERDTLNLITELEKNYLYDYPLGSWTEKTSELLCMLASLHEKKEFTHEDFLTKFHNFIVKGYHSPNDKIFEVNLFVKTTGGKIANCLKYRKPLPLILNPYDYHQNDCQPLLRIAPIVRQSYRQPDICLKQITIACQLTHISPICVDGCQFFSSLMIGALMGVHKDTLLTPKFNVMDVTTYGSIRYDRLDQPYLQHCSDTVVTLVEDTEGPESPQIFCQSTKQHTFIRSLYPAIQRIRNGSYKNKQRSEIISDELMLNTLEAVLWAFHGTNSFEEGCIMAINLGLNSSAIGAIYGQLAGFYYGYQDIPDRWINKLQKKDYILELI